MKTAIPSYFKHFAYIDSKISDETLKKLKAHAKFIINNEEKYKKYNNQLAGNLEKEYEIPEVKKLLEKSVISLANEYYNHQCENNDCLNWEIESLWINFQKKYEYNPIHDHSGILSFVIWIQIPYDLKEEFMFENCRYSKNPKNSLFEFVFTDFLGKITTSAIEVDKSYEGTIIMFPSSLNHIVYPFYTSEDYRISISGNLIIAPQNNKLIYQ